MSDAMTRFGGDGNSLVSSDLFKSLLETNKTLRQRWWRPTYQHQGRPLPRDHRRHAGAPVQGRQNQPYHRERSTAGAYLLRGCL